MNMKLTVSVDHLKPLVPLLETHDWNTIPILSYVLLQAKNDQQ